MKTQKKTDRQSLTSYGIHNFRFCSSFNFPFQEVRPLGENNHLGMFALILACLHLSARQKENNPLRYAYRETLTIITHQ